jgi:hypothetical protein
MTNMARIEGITTKKDSRKNLSLPIINIKKQPEAILPFMEMGLTEKAQFEKDCENGISVEDARRHTLEFIRNLPWKK